MSSRLLIARWATLWTSRLCFLYVNNLYRDVKMIFMIFFTSEIYVSSKCIFKTVKVLNLWGVLCVNLNLKFASQLNAVVVVDSASCLVGARTQLRHQSPWVFWSVGGWSLSSQVFFSQVHAKLTKCTVKMSRFNLFPYINSDMHIQETNTEFSFLRIQAILKSKIVDAQSH